MIDLSLETKLQLRLASKELFMEAPSDLIVIGGGHAACEAAHIATKLGLKVQLFTMNLDAIANLPCNPNIGGTAKGQLVREVDALGGLIAKAADACGIQFRMLNEGKGPAVRSPRAQVDRRAYQAYMKTFLENLEGLWIRQVEITELVLSEHLTSDGRQQVLGVVSKNKAFYPTQAVLMATGTYLDSRIIIGDVIYPGGPDNMFPSQGLGASIKEAGLPVQRFKTGTPVRVNRRSLDLDAMELQPGDSFPWYFSFENEMEDPNGLNRIAVEDQLPCYITWTNEETHHIIQENLYRSPLYSGVIEGTGTRYCPSIEDKIVKFSDKPRHQVFVEPMGVDTEEYYVMGMSSSMPEEVQLEFLRTLKGFEHAVVQRMGYAIEYTCLDPTCLLPSLESKTLSGFFSAGQINGTSGYEEAAAQGIIAGINAALKIQNKEPFILDRSKAYIGVLIDDLCTKGTAEPYRMMTSRAEYRLYLRQDNADRRLTPLAYDLGIISESRMEAFRKKESSIETEIKRLRLTRLRPNDYVNRCLLDLGTSELKGGTSLAELLQRPEIRYLDLEKLEGKPLPDLTVQERFSVETELKYEGYLKIEQARIERFKKLESKKLPKTMDYFQISGLRKEAQQKLDKFKPQNIGQASRISGVSPADIQVLLVALEFQMKLRKDQI